MKNEDLKIARHHAQSAREASSRALAMALSPAKRRMFERLEKLAFEVIISIENDLEDRGESEEAA